MMNYPVEPGLRYPTSRFQGIIDAVRTIVLEWSLRLEKDGVSGEEMDFSTKEKEVASSSTYHIQNYISQVTNSQIQQNTHESVMRMTVKPLDLGAIEGLLQEIGAVIAQSKLHEKQLADLRADIGTIEAQMKSSNPKEKIIREAFQSIRNILEGALGSALASGVLTQIGCLLG